MNVNRRDALKAGGGLAVFSLAVAAGLIKLPEAMAEGWNNKAFDAKSLADVMKALGGEMPQASSSVSLTAPDIAENGAVVPVGVVSSLPNTQEVAILVEKNPTTLSAHFVLGEGTEPNVNTRVKMGQTSDVIALVKADNKYYFAKKEVKVTLGGCGG